jgi:hypothetical protein
MTGIVKMTRIILNLSKIRSYNKYKNNQFQSIMINDIILFIFTIPVILIP